ncbi:putative transcription regulator [Photobacterium marinum]|uniref:Putative transcription regulator n=1 Tax=Photobacterium marinum TaxID=1056511 RepID=L8JBJ1_9GAMM|nr:MarR family transcriptional regulator [Photobacterium marinum]ELR64929.1 putative transcription regulator [Photobacterium marinum]
MVDMTSRYLFDLMQRYRAKMKTAVGAKALNLNAMHIQCIRYINEVGNCTANLIVQGLDRDKSQISLVIRDMAKRGWIELLPNPEDKRSKLIKLTDEGTELLEKVIQEEAVVAQKMKEGLSHEDIETFDRIVLTMQKNLMK